MHEGLYRFRDESLIWYNLACYACVLGDKARARKMLDKAIELGGDKVKLRALDDPDLQGVWVSGEGSYHSSSSSSRQLITYQSELRKC